MFNFESLAKSMGLDRVAETMKEELDRYVKAQEEMTALLKAILGILVKIEKRLTNIENHLEGSE